jgi:hypothetical protein
MQYFQMTFIASVDPGKPWTQEDLDRLEAKFQIFWMAIECNGGVNLMDESKRKRAVRNGRKYSALQLYFFKS